MRVALAMLFCPVLLSAQGAKPSGFVAPGLAEFRIPLEQPADAVWKWNRAETRDNDVEYLWQVAVPKAQGRYAFGFYLYKLPGSKPAHGNLQALLKAGQASVFREDAEGRGTLIENAAVSVSAENDQIVIRITDAALIRKLFGSRPDTVTINTRAIGTDFEVVKVAYRDGNPAGHWAGRVGGESTGCHPDGMRRGAEPFALPPSRISSVQAGSRVMGE